MKLSKHQKSGILVLGSWVWMIVLIVLFSVDKTISVYFFGMSIGIIVLYVWSSLLIGYALPYIENNKRKSNQNIIIYIFQIGFKLLYRFVVNILFLLVFVSVIALWFWLPFYYLKDYSGFYQKICLPLLGGIIGEGIWGLLYFALMTFLGYLVYEKIIYKIDKTITKILDLV